ncbi:hypothetical protein SAY87_023097 [Trapa incisa]|uniref:Uncharacterized protein n=1 Tax=Trapa incisa TaxID=236973 RepID=A0AAN7K8M2_9MYRT|nr:hypothetical protein SAY87_023097 [Trapa incisa]
MVTRSPIETGIFIAGSDFIPFENCRYIDEKCMDKYRFWTGRRPGQSDGPKCRWYVLMFTGNEVAGHEDKTELDESFIIITIE